VRARPNLASPVTTHALSPGCAGYWVCGLGTSGTLQFRDLLGASSGLARRITCASPTSALLKTLWLRSPAQKHLLANTVNPQVWTLPPKVTRSHKYVPLDWACSARDQIERAHRPHVNVIDSSHCSTPMNLPNTKGSYHNLAALVSGEGGGGGPSLAGATGLAGPGLGTRSSRFQSHSETSEAAQSKPTRCWVWWRCLVAC
jgi:hypothetical protein